MAPGRSQSQRSSPSRSTNAITRDTEAAKRLPHSPTHRTGDHAMTMHATLPTVTRRDALKLAAVAGAGQFAPADTEAGTTSTPPARSTIETAPLEDAIRE